MSRRRNWWLLAAAIAIAMVVAWLLYRLYRSPSSNRNDFSTFGAFAWPVAGAAVGLLAWAWQKSTRRPFDSSSADKLDHAADVLGMAIQKQWEEAAAKRGLDGTLIPVTWGSPSRPMAVPVDAAVESHRFDPLPGLPPITEADLASGQASDLHALYGGLRSGRLIIAGPPGSGKSGAAVRLVLAALRHRKELLAQDGLRVPVPVLLTAQDWDPKRQPAVDWLTRKLRDTYPMFATAMGAETVTELITSGRITVILDGLDEIREDLRPVALRALNEQATFRLVLLSRTSEMAAAATQGILDGAVAVELNPVESAEAARYLELRQLTALSPEWRELTGRLRVNWDSPLSQALSTPLALTLVRDIYQVEDEGSIRELLEFCDTLDGQPADKAVEAITDHLLDRFLIAAYADRPGELSPYGLKTAERALTRIAAQMKKDGTRDLNWWQIPAWLPRKVRIARAIVSGLPVGLVYGLVGGFVSGPTAGFAFGFSTTTGTLLGVAMNIVSELAPVPVRKLWARLIFPRLLAAEFVYLFMIMLGLASASAPVSMIMLWFAEVSILMGMLGSSFIAAYGVTNSLSPTTSWRLSRRWVLVFWIIIFGLGPGLLIVFSAHGSEVAPEAGIGVIFGIMVGIAELGSRGSVGLTLAASYAVTVASVQLAFKWRTPVRLMKFLEDAYERAILRAVGPSYQFRHARLQDRLAELAGGGERAEPAQEVASSAG